MRSRELKGRVQQVISRRSLDHKVRKTPVTFPELKELNKLTAEEKL